MELGCWPADTVALPFSLVSWCSCLTSELLVNGYTYFPPSMSPFQIAKGIRHLTKLVPPLDNWSHLSRLNEIAQNGQVLLVQRCQKCDEFLTDEPRSNIGVEFTEQNSDDLTSACPRSSNAGHNADPV